MQRGHLEVSAPQDKGQLAEAAFVAVARAPNLMPSAKERSDENSKGSEHSQLCRRERGAG
jgi:hypothetical protein